MRYKVLFLVLLVFVFISQVYAAVDPSSATWTVYKTYLYESGACTGTPQTVLDNSSGVTQDFNTTPTLGTAPVTSSTYNCVALKISDTVTFIPSSNEGSECVAGTSYTIGVCPSGVTSTDADDSSDISCTNSTDKIWVYISTWSTSTGGDESNNALTPPTSNGDATKGINLGSALTVTDDLTGYFIVDASGTIATQNTGTDGAAQCDMQPPLFSFIAVTEPSTS